MTENMTAPPKIERLVFAYLLEGDDEPQRVTVYNRSLIAWDETRGKRKWPTSTEAPSLWQTFIVWHHLNRSGKTALTFDQFKDACLALELQDEGEPVDPTQPTAGPESSSESD